MKNADKKEQAKQSALKALEAIQSVERAGGHGAPEWHRAQEAYGRALRAYRKAGALNHEIFCLGR